MILTLRYSEGAVGNEMRTRSRPVAQDAQVRACMPHEEALSEGGPQHIHTQPSGVLLLAKEVVGRLIV